MPMPTSTKKFVIGMRINIPTDGGEISGSTHSAEQTTTTGRKPQHKLGRRHSIASPVMLTYNQSKQDEPETAVEDDDTVAADLDALQIPHEKHQMIRQDSHLSEPLLSLGELASLMMPPKLVKDDTHLNKKMTSRRQSCCF
jgi:hypothetical protein